jgi:hypothetical protein
VAVGSGQETDKFQAAPSVEIESSASAAQKARTFSSRSTAVAGMKSILGGMEEAIPKFMQ